jgi:hypothetical protein
MLPPWVVEAIDSETDSEGEPRGAFVARLALERLQATTQTPGLARKIEHILYYKHNPRRQHKDRVQVGLSSGWTADPR